MSDPHQPLPKWPRLEGVGKVLPDDVEIQRRETDELLREVIENQRVMTQQQEQSGKRDRHILWAALVTLVVTTAGVAYTVIATLIELK